MTHITFTATAEQLQDAEEQISQLLNVLNSAPPPKVILSPVLDEKCYAIYEDWWLNTREKALKEYRL